MRDTGEPDEAEDLHEQAISLAQQINERGIQAEGLVGLAHAVSAGGDTDRAWGHLEQALAGFVRQLRPRFSVPTDRTAFVEKGCVRENGPRLAPSPRRGHAWAFLDPCLSRPSRRRRSRWSARSKAEDVRPGGAASTGHA
ncbi:tetratricopeptide repeat protein [Actinocrispum sp. NPDC049592]|uniref:tetratricopeptide repeat protein n=1 Tax=Actinocrispum sp. NPDC049592 TaxID=3154835 RepID=UPI0034164984